MFNFAVFMCKYLTNNWEAHKRKKTDNSPTRIMHTSCKTMSVFSITKKENPEGFSNLKFIYNRNYIL